MLYEGATACSKFGDHNFNHFYLHQEDYIFTCVCLFIC